MANTKVGKRIAELRSERNLTQRQLAAATEDKQDVVTYTSKYPPKSRY